MPKFFVDKKQISDENIIITGDDAKHIKTVLRSKVGDKLTLCDGDSNDFLCEIQDFQGNDINTLILEKIESVAEPRVKITLFQGMPKADKMELIIQKCVELGIDRIVPVMTEHTIVKLDKKDKEAKKIERWQKISESAAKQSGRGKIPLIENVIDFKNAILEANKLDGAIIPYEKEEKNGIKSFVNSFNGKSIGVFIGPEGGFAESEIKFALEQGVFPVTLGKRILRTETAGLATVSILLYELG